MMRKFKRFLEGQTRIFYGVFFADFFQFLMAGNIPFTIASTSGKENIDFYFEHLELGKWFSYDKVIYNDGSFRGKPYPDIFLLAATKLELNPKETMVFEDSFPEFKLLKMQALGK